MVLLLPYLLLLLLLLALCNRIAGEARAPKYYSMGQTVPWAKKGCRYLVGQEMQYRQCRLYVAPYCTISCCHDGSNPLVQDDDAFVTMPPFACKRSIGLPAGCGLERRPEPPVAIILCVLLVVAILSIKPILSNFGEIREQQPSQLLCSKRWSVFSCVGVLFLLKGSRPEFRLRAYSTRVTNRSSAPPPSPFNASDFLAEQSPSWQ